MWDKNLVSNLLRFVSVIKIPSSREDNSKHSLERALKDMTQKGSLNEYVFFIIERFRAMLVDIEENHIKVFMNQE